MVKSMYGGGAQRVILVLAQQFVKMGFQVRIITMYRKEDYSIPKEIACYSLDIDEKNLSVEYNMSKLKQARAFLSFSEEDAFIIRSSSASLYKYAMFLSEGIDTIKIASMSNDPFMSPSTEHGRMERDRAFMEWKKINGKFVFQTEYERNYFPVDIQEKSVIINNPLTTELPDLCCSKKKKIVTVGRLTEQKNLPLLICAFSDVIKKHPDYILEIYGEGELRSSLEMLANGLGVPVHFHGFSKSVLKEISDAQVFVLSSNFEGVSNAMLEALCLGIPSICTDCPAYGARKFITDHENGILVPVNDREKLSEAIIELIENENLRSKLSKNSKKIISELKVESICEEFIRLFGT